MGLAAECQRAAAFEPVLLASCPPAERRAAEVTDLDYETVAADMARRDAPDQGRDTDPLRLADGALEIDTTDMTIEQIVDDLAGRIADG